MSKQKNVYVVSLEPIDTRYTGQWYKHVPEGIKKYAELKGKNVNVVNIAGTKVENKTTPGAFLDFAATNIWKSSQMIKISKLFQEGKVQKDDVFLFTDFWNPTVVQLRYMSELLNIPVKIFGIAHAGSYDPWDFLGRLIGNKPWVRKFEESLVYTFDKLFFATEFHIKLFKETFTDVDSRRLIRTGFPMDYFPDLLEPFSGEEKRDLIVFPHRMAPEKQVDIFKDLAKNLPEFEFVICQEKKLSKKEYHKILGQSKIVFSANLQETLGIGCMEAIFTNSIPLVPDRLSYSEMYKNEFKYPSEWTLDFKSYQRNKSQIIEKIRFLMLNHEKLVPTINAQKKSLIKGFINPKIMYEYIV